MLTFRFNKGIYEGTLFKRDFTFSTNLTLLDNYNRVGEIIFKYDGNFDYVVEIRTGEKIPIVYNDINISTNKSKIKAPLADIKEYGICVIMQRFHNKLKEEKYFLMYDKIRKFYRLSDNLLFSLNTDDDCLKFENIINDYLTKNSDKENLKSTIENIRREGAEVASIDLNTCPYKPIIQYYSIDTDNLLYNNRGNWKEKINRYYNIDYTSDLKNEIVKKKILLINKR